MSGGVSFLQSRKQTRIAACASLAGLPTRYSSVAPYHQVDRRFLVDGLEHVLYLPGPASFSGGHGAVMGMHGNCVQKSRF